MRRQLCKIHITSYLSYLRRAPSKLSSPALLLYVGVFVFTAEILASEEASPKAKDSAELLTLSLKLQKNNG